MDQSPDGGGPVGAPIVRIYTREFWLIFAATAALNGAANLFLMFPLFVVKLGGGASTIGAIVGTGSMAALLMRPGVSAALERRGHRWTALWTVALDAMMVLLYIPLRSLGWPIYLVRAMQGAAEGSARVALFALVYDILPAGRQGEAMATFSLSGMGPAAIGALLGEGIMRRWGFHAFFCAAGFLCVASALAVAMLPRDRRVVTRPSLSEGEGNRWSYSELLTRTPLMTFWVIALLFGISNSVRSSFVAPFAYQRGIHSVGWYFTIYALTAVFVRLTGRMLDRIGLERLLFPSFLSLALGIAMLAGLGHLGVLEIAGVLGGLGHGFAYPALSALIIRHTPEGATSRSSTIYTSLWDLSAMLGPYLFGLTAHQFGYPLMFLGAGAMTAIATLFVNRHPAAEHSIVAEQPASVA